MPVRLQPRKLYPRKAKNDYERVSGGLLSRRLSRRRVCAALQRLQGEFLIEMKDAAYVTREQVGKIKLHQTQPVVGLATGMGVSRGTVWGALIGLLLMQPLLGMAAGAVFGAASGAIAGRMADYGIPDQFVKDLAGELQPRNIDVIRSVPKGHLGEGSAPHFAVWRNRHA